MRVVGANHYVCCPSVLVQLPAGATVPDTLANVNVSPDGSLSVVICQVKQQSVLAVLDNRRRKLSRTIAIPPADRAYWSPNSKGLVLFSVAPDHGLRWTLVSIKTGSLLELPHSTEDVVWLSDSTAGYAVSKSLISSFYLRGNAWQLYPTSSALFARDVRQDSCLAFLLKRNIEYGASNYRVHRSRTSMIVARDDQASVGRPTRKDIWGGSGETMMCQDVAVVGGRSNSLPRRIVLTEQPLFFCWIGEREATLCPGSLFFREAIERPEANVTVFYRLKVAPTGVNIKAFGVTGVHDIGWIVPQA